MNTQNHYENKSGNSLYKFAQDYELNAYEFDIIKRIIRCRKKGNFEQDLNKTKDVIDIYLKEFESVECFHESEKVYYEGLEYMVIADKGDDKVFITNGYLKSHSQHKELIVNRNDLTKNPTDEANEFLQSIKTIL